MDAATVCLLMVLGTVVLVAVFGWGLTTPPAPPPRHPFADPDGGPTRTHGRARHRDVSDDDRWRD